MGTRAPSVAHPCCSTKVVTMFSNVIPCKGSRGCAIECGWCVDESGMRKRSVPIVDEFHKGALAECCRSGAKAVIGKEG